MLTVLVRYVRVAFVILLFLLVSVGGVITPSAHASVDPLVHSTHKGLSSEPFNPQDLRVMIVGSSVADGWRDRHGGYLKRTFDALSRIDHIRYDLIDKAIPGLGASILNSQYPGWLEQENPQVVVIAWGVLDDLQEHTPLPAFAGMIHEEIELALAEHAVVIVVTTPVSKASYTEYRNQQALYLNIEMQVAQSFHSPNVYTFDVFDEMKAYLASHGLTYAPFMADGWHPNTRGHALASHLLIHDMVSLFGRRPIHYVGSWQPGA